MFCEKCGSELKDNDKFCRNCGYEIPIDLKNIIIDEEKEHKEETSEESKETPEAPKKHSWYKKALICVIVLYIIGRIFGNDGEKPSNTSSTEATVSKTKTTEKNYLTESIKYDGWSISPRYAYITTTGIGEFYVKVRCQISNNSSDTQTFKSSNFSVNNNGIIKDANGLFGEYNYTEIASGAGFETDIEFLFPNNSNKNFDDMTMSVGDSSICLGYRPQDEEYKDKFFGNYVRGKGTEYQSVIAIAPTDREGMYGATSYTYSDVLDEVLITNEDDITLDENNLFKINGHYYKWVPEEYSIYVSDSTGSNIINDNFRPWQKY